MTKEEAQKQVDERVELLNKRTIREDCYCPDIKSMCRLDCILFVKTSGRIVSIDDGTVDSWYPNTSGGYCRRHMK